MHGTETKWVYIRVKRGVGTRTLR